MEGVGVIAGACRVLVQKCKKLEDPVLLQPCPLLVCSRVPGVGGARCTCQANADITRGA